MLKILKKKWAENEAVLRASLAGIKNMNRIEYNDLVKMTFENIYNSGKDEFKRELLDVEGITQIDNGDYQGTLIFLIPFDVYQPGPEDYLMTYVYYGSCSGCDALQNIQFNLCGDYSGPPNEQQISDLLTLCRDLVMNAIKPYNSGWRKNELFESVEDEDIH